MSKLAIEALSKHYGTVRAVDALSLDVGQGEFVSLVGPSGCGKTTVLRMVAGLIDPDGGRIRLGEADITRLPVHRRNIGLVFQSYALFPHLSVFENVAFGLRRRGVAEAALRRRVGTALEQVQLDALAERKPAALSGGQQQRVALARAVVIEPALLLLDEPLSNLDALLRDEMRIELKRLQARLGTTTLFVTHDQAEALSLSDRVAVMRAGRLEQVGAPESIYARPATTFVAGFIGRSNQLAGVVERHEGGLLQVRVDGGLELKARTERPLPVGARVLMVLRHERIRLLADPSLANLFQGVVTLRAFVGNLVQYVVRVGEIDLQAERPGTERPVQLGERVLLGFAAEDVLVLPEGAP